MRLCVNHPAVLTIPITGQTFGVLLVAMALGRVRGSAVVLAYLAEGAAGLPVFAGGAAGIGVLAGPTGGYLIGFLLAAYLTGWLADHGWDRGYFKSAAAMLAGNVVLFGCGWPNCRSSYRPVPSWRWACIRLWWVGLSRSLSLP